MYTCEGERQTTSIRAFYAQSGEARGRSGFPPCRSPALVTPTGQRGVLTLTTCSSHHLLKLIGVSSSPASEKPPPLTVMRGTASCLKAQLGIFTSSSLSLSPSSLSVVFAQPKKFRIGVKQECFDPFTAICIEASAFN